MRDRARSVLGLLMLLGVGSCGDPAPPAPQPPIGTAEGERPPPLEGLLPTGEAFEGLDAVEKPAVLVFYRSATCGLCRVQLEQIQENIGGYRGIGAEVVGVTLDSPDVSQALVDELAITFPLVSVDTTEFRDWGVFDADRGVPLPATYVIGDEGTIRFRHIGRNASDRTTDAGVLTILETISGQ